MKNEAKTGQNARPITLIPFARARPVWFFFVAFFYLLGIAHAVDDLAHYALGWQLKVGHEYVSALIMTVTVAFIIPWFPSGISFEQREAEKKILAQAADIDRAARNAAGTK